MKRLASFVIVLLSLVLAASAATATRGATPTGRTDAPEACGPKFTLVQSGNVGTGENRLKGVASNGGLVVAVGFYTKPNGRKAGLIEIWDGAKMRVKTSDLGGYASEFVGIAPAPSGGFKMVGIVWTKVRKGLMSRIVVGNFDGRFFRKETDIRIPGSIQNIAHRILVTESVTWVSGYSTRVFEDNVPTDPPEEDTPLPIMPPFVKGNSPTYPLLVRLEGTAWKQVPFAGQGWLYGIAGRSPTDVVVVGTSGSDGAIYRLQGEEWAKLPDLDSRLPGREGKLLYSMFFARKEVFYSVLGVIFTPGGIFVSGYHRVLSGNKALVEGIDGFLTDGFLPKDGFHFQLIEEGKAVSSRLVASGGDQLKVLVPALPGHWGWGAVYGVSRINDESSTPRLSSNPDAVFYPGYRDRDYPYVQGEDITTVPEKGEVWVVGADGSGRTIVMRACPPLHKSAVAGS